MPDILSHLEDFTAFGEDALIFTGPKNAQLRRSNFSQAWRDATETANLTGFHCHDLRHTGNTLASCAAGASLHELMERMGHSTTRAALILGFPSQRGEILLKGGSPMGETRRKFDKDFREGAVRLVRETGKPIAQVARDLGINAGTLGNWVDADRRRREGGDRQPSEDERAELARLRKENAELQMRCDVLKRSVALWVSDAMGSR